MWETLETALTYLRTAGGWIWRHAVELVKEHPVAALLAAIAAARMFGVVVETGWRGVLFSFGKTQRELEPGFHWLAPIVHHVRKVRVRSVSFDLPLQRIVTRDGLAYDVDANLVYHVEDATAAVVEIDDVDRGCRTVAPLVIASLLREQESRQLADRSRLDQELAERVQDRVRRWGVVVEHAGFKSIAPTRETLRITQLRLRCAERARLFGSLLQSGAADGDALTLLGAPSRLVAKSTAAYRGYHRRLPVGRRLASLLPPKVTPLKVGDRVWANWLELGDYYPGVITKTEGETFHVRYDDGDEEQVHVRNIRRQKPE